MGKVYTIVVGVEYPWVGADDVFEVNVEFTDTELEEIIQGGIRLMYNESMDISTSEFIEVLSKTAYDKLNATAEKVAAKKWGEKMLIANSARYRYFLPEDISDAIFDAPEVNEIYDQRKKNEEQSHLQFKSDSEILFSNHKEGRWHDRLLPDPHWNNKPFGGIWSGPSIGSFDHNFPLYGFHCTIMIDGEKTEVSYTVSYFLESYEFEIRVFKFNPKVVKIFEDRLNTEGYSIKKKLPIGEPVYSYVIYAEGTDPKKFVSTYMNIIDDIIKL